MKWVRGQGSESSSHLVLLQFQLLHVVELLRLQLAHPVMQLVDLIPAGNIKHYCLNNHQVTPGEQAGPQVSRRSTLQLVLVQVVNVQLLASGGQNLLLLLSLCLLLASSLLVSLVAQNIHVVMRLSETRVHGLGY